MQSHQPAWNDLSDLQKQVHMLVYHPDQALSYPADDVRSEAATPGPAVDIHEDADRILLIADLPGLEQSEVDISLENNTLVLRGERKAEATPEGKGQHHLERAQGRFARSFTLPLTVDIDAVTAEMKTGVLRVTLPKKQEAKPRQVKINVASA